MYLLEGPETDRLIFRKLEQSDFAAWLPFHKDPKSSQYWSGLPSDPMIACQEDFDRTFERYENNLGGRMALIQKNTTNFIGLCGLMVQHVDGVEELEIGYSILPEYWGQGYATEAAMACKEFAKARRLSTSLISIIHIDNLPSKKVALNNGMHLDKTTTYKKNPVEIYRVHF